MKITKIQLRMLKVFTAALLLDIVVYNMRVNYNNFISYIILIVIGILISDELSFLVRKAIRRSSTKDERGKSYVK